MIQEFEEISFTLYVSSMSITTIFFNSSNFFLSLFPFLLFPRQQIPYIISMYIFGKVHQIVNLVCRNNIFSTHKIMKKHYKTKILIKTYMSNLSPPSPVFSTNYSGLLIASSIKFVLLYKLKNRAKYLLRLEISSLLLVNM